MRRAPERSTIFETERLYHWGLPHQFENESQLCYYCPRDRVYGDLASANKKKAIELCKMFSNGTIPYREFIKFGFKTTFSDFVGRNQVEILGQENLRLSKSSIPPIIPIIAWFGATLRLDFKLLLSAVMVRAFIFVCIVYAAQMLVISG